jgi:hypothetical protein
MIKRLVILVEKLLNIMKKSFKDTNCSSVKVTEIFKVGLLQLPRYYLSYLERKLTKATANEV